MAKHKRTYVLTARGRKVKAIATFIGQLFVLLVLAGLSGMWQ